MKEKLLCVSEIVADSLYNSVENNIELYRAGDFVAIAQEYGWSVKLKVDVDFGLFADLIGDDGFENEVANSLIVWKTLGHLSPGLACENRLWTRIAHVEGFAFSRKRWLDTRSDSALVSSVRAHFFANSRTKWRDDNAISRLWWSAYIAKQVFPDNQKLALECILMRADIRSNLIERSQTSSRPTITAGIVRTMIHDSWIIQNDKNFRTFMKVLNKYGGGILFESLSDSSVDNFMAGCVARAKSEKTES